MNEITRDKIDILKEDICSICEFLFCLVVGIFYLVFYKINDFVKRILKKEELKK